MSWDLFVQNWGSFNSLEDIPDDYEPKPIGKRSEIISKIMNAEPTVTFVDATFGTMENEHFSIEFSLGEEEELYSFTMHVSGSEMAVSCVGNILSALELKATDGSTPNFFDIEDAKLGLAKWEAYRNQILNR